MPPTRTAVLALLRNLHQRSRESEVGGRGEVEPAEPDPVRVRIGGRAGGNHEVPDVEIRSNPACAADADQARDAVRPDELGCVDQRRRDPHAGAHHRYPSTAIRPGVALHVAHSSDQHSVVEKPFRDVPCAQGVAGEEADVGEVSRGG